MGPVRWRLWVSRFARLPVRSPVRSTLTAHSSSDLPANERINRAYVHTALKPLLPALLLGKKVATLLRNLLRLVAQHTYRHRENVSKPRKAGHKPHKPMTQKQC
jgi:hypothetical protein